MSLPLFDSVASESAKVVGMNRAANNRPVELEYARNVAKQLARAKGEITADQVQEILIAQGIELKNAAGSIFKDPAFEFAGRYEKSARVKAHSNLLRVWRLK